MVFIHGVHSILPLKKKYGNIENVIVLKYLSPLGENS